MIPEKLSLWQWPVHKKKNLQAFPDDVNDFIVNFLNKVVLWWLKKLQEE